MQRNWADVSDQDSPNQDSRNSSGSESSRSESPEAPKARPALVTRQPVSFNAQFTKERKDRKQRGEKEHQPKDFMDTEALEKQISLSKTQVKQLSIVYCFHLDQQSIKQKYPMVKSAKNYRSGSYELNFQTQADLLKFLVQKETNKDKFFIKLNQQRPPNNSRQGYAQKEPSRYRNEARQKQHNKECKPKKTPVNIFQENKWVFDDKLSAKEVADSISNNRLLDSFESIRIVVPEANQLQPATLLVQAACKELNLAFTRERRLEKQEFRLRTAETKTQTVQQLTPSLKNKPKVERAYKQKQQYVDNNLIVMTAQMDVQEVLKEISAKKIFNHYDVIKIKSSRGKFKEARSLAESICSRLRCELGREQQKDGEIILSLHVKKPEEKGRSLLSENKIVMVKGANAQKTVEDVKATMTNIFKQFNCIKIEYTSDLKVQAKHLCDELNRIGLAVVSEQPKSNDPSITVISLSEGNHEPKIKQRVIPTKHLFNVEQNNTLTIATKLPIENVATEFQKVRKQLFSKYKSLKITCSDPSLYVHARDIAQRLSQFKLGLNESVQKKDSTETLTIELDEKARISTRPKLHVGTINDYLST